MPPNWRLLKATLKNDKDTRKKGLAHVSAISDVQYIA